MSSRVIWGSLAATLLVVVSITLALRYLSPEDTPARASPIVSKPELNKKSTPAAMVDQETTSSEVATASASEAFSPSLVGTEPDGYFSVDKNGNLKVTRGTRDLFDYYFSTIGERSLADITEHIEQHARQSLPPSAANQAMNLLHDYMDYHRATEQYMQQDLDPEQRENYSLALESAFLKLMDLRRQYFSSDTAEAFFGTEEAYGQYVLKRLRLSENVDLSEPERAQQMALLEQSAPKAITDTKNRTSGQVEMMQRIDSVRRQGGSENAIQQIRREYVGEEEARRLAEIDADNAAWEKQYSQYAAERKQLMESSGLSGADRNASIQGLREYYFEGPGLHRAEMRDRASTH